MAFNVFAILLEFKAASDVMRHTFLIIILIMVFSTFFTGFKDWVFDSTVAIIVYLSAAREKAFVCEAAVLVLGHKVSIAALMTFAVGEVKVAVWDSIDTLVLSFPVVDVNLVSRA